MGVRVNAILLALTMAPAVAQTPTPTPAAPPLFAAPKGWFKSTPPNLPSPMVGLANYLSNVDGYAQVFLVAQGPSAGLDMHDYAQLNMQSIKAIPDVKVFADEATTVCNGRPAWLTKYRKIENGKSLMMSQVFTVSGAHAYIATYIRLASHKDDPLALAALQSLCPPVEASAADTSEVPFGAPDTFKRVNPSIAKTDQEILGMWLGDASGAFPETINIVRVHSGSSQPISAHIGLVQETLKKQLPVFVLRQSHAEQVCGGKYDGWYLEYNAQVREHPAILEQVIVVTDTSEFIATYGRPLAHSENAAARQSLDTLCPVDASVNS